MDVRRWNREAWDRQVTDGNKWTRPVSPEEIARARAGDWSVVLTPTKPVPRTWFPATLGGARVLGLASGGGQQCPVLAAVRPVWREAFRVLRPGGTLLAGFCNPVMYAVAEGDPELRVKNAIPYSDVLAGRIREGEAVEFGHSLEDQIGGQLDAGFHLTALFEDVDATRPLVRFLPEFTATRAVKP